MRGIGHNLGINMLATGGTKNHIHSLISLPPTKLVAHVIRDLKANSSRHLNEVDRFAWQDGYAAISVSPSMIGKVSQYIASQEQRHRRVPFEVEYKLLMDKAGLRYDPQFLYG
jgi:REP element-mobilizing transposase RayT